VLDLASGALEPTGNPLDLAIRGDAFFVVETPEGERYTRNGALMLNSEGVLVTSDGNPVIGSGGLLRFDVQDGAPSIAADGTVSTETGPKGRLRLVRFADPQRLEHLGGNLFASPEPAEAAPEAQVQAGYVERSNVSPVLEMSRMIDVSRQYELIAQMMSRNDDSRRTAIQKLGEPV